MTSLSFPDINVWLALIREDHVHRGAAVRWWNTDPSDSIAFCRFTQIGVLRLLTTPAAMNGRPLSMADAWRVYDSLLEDERVTFLPEPTQMDDHFRKRSSLKTASAKLWADAYLEAFAKKVNGTLITFDKGFTGRGIHCRVLAGE